MVFELLYLFFTDHSKTECSDVTQCLVVFLWTLSVFVSNIKPQYFGNGSIFAFRMRGDSRSLRTLGWCFSYSVDEPIGMGILGNYISKIRWFLYYILKWYK